MKGWILVGLVLISELVASQGVHKYWVGFKDKAGNGYSIQNPEKFLSSRAIERRTRYNIPILSNDMPVSETYVQSVLGVGVQLHSRSKWLNGIVIVTGDSAKVDSILTMSFVKAVERVFVDKPGKRQQTDKKFTEESVTSNARSNTDELSYGVTSDQIQMLNGQFLHESGYKGKGMYIAILDAGFARADSVDELAHIWSDGRLIDYWDFVNKDNGVFDEHSHGEEVLSIIGSNAPGAYVGGAPEASFILYRTEDAASEYPIEEYNWVVGAEKADSLGADVINSSLGYTTFDDTSASHTYADMDGNTTVITKGADIAASKGILVVNSAGNSGGSAWNYIGAPADGDSVFTIGAVGLNVTVAPFSSRGPTSDNRLKPNVCALGWGTAVVAPFGDYVYGNGTSFSSPIIAGLSACLWQAFPDRSNMEILQAIEACSHKYSNPDYDFGNGVPNLIRAFLDLSGKAVDDESTDHLISVFPSPFEDQVQVLFYSSEEQLVSLELTDVSGRKVYVHNEILNKGEYKQFKIPGLSNVLPGVYILRVMSPQGSSSEKLIKNQ